LTQEATPASLRASMLRTPNAKKSIAIAFVARISRTG
jgi:hypothetical protein